MNKNVIGNKSTFAVEYSFHEDHTTEIALFVTNKNILAYNKNGQDLTTRWNLDELVSQLRSFIDTMQPDPYPVECDGDYAAVKDINARNFDSDDDDVLDAYYEKLYEWNLRHRWHHASEGAILADVYFNWLVIMLRYLGTIKMPKKALRFPKCLEEN